MNPPKNSRASGQNSRALGRWFLLAVLPAATVLAHAQAADALPSAGAPAVAGAPSQAPGVRLPADADWPRHGFDDAETRHSPLAQIDAGNVHRLGVAWSWEIPKTGARLETTPIVADGILYGTGPLSYVFALDAATGEVAWTWDPAIPEEEKGGPRACCGDVNRGVAVEGGAVFVGLLDGRLTALDRSDGSVRWTVQTTPAGSDYTITGAPRVIADRVVVGNGGAEYGVRGYVTAYHVETGEQLWRTYTVPGDPALGHVGAAMAAAAMTWTGEWWKAGGGGTVWDAIVVDEDAGLVYAGTGNGSPWNRDHRSPGGGDNLYLSSILALDAQDGEIVWHYQTTPGDDWDYTATQPLMLLDLETGEPEGAPRPVIVQAPKNGFFYVLDRLTGELISAERFADDLTWATHVDLDTGRPVETPGARYGMTGQGLYLAPGPRGAHNWHPMSWNAVAALVYLPAQNNNAYFEMADTFEYRAGQWNTGTQRNGARSERPPLKGSPNVLLAWDPSRNQEVWRVEGQGGHGGTMSTAGNLVFWGTGSRLVALNATTGEELWSAEVGRGTGSPVAYAIGGRQYVAVAAGLSTGGGAPRVWAFVLEAEGASSEVLGAVPPTPGVRPIP